MKKWFGIAVICAIFIPFMMGQTSNGGSCTDTDSVVQQQQEQSMAQGQAAVGMPAIANWYEKKQLKMCYELRDKSNLNTYTYLFAQNPGKLVFLGRSIGYGIPYATQFSNPMKQMFRGNGATIPQAEPNGLFPPSSAEGTWVFLIDPKGDIKPTYIEPPVIVSQFPLTTN